MLHMNMSSRSESNVDKRMMCFGLVVHMDGEWCFIIQPCPDEAGPDISV